MVFDYSKLSSRIISMFCTFEAFAQEVGQTPTTVSYKLNNKKPMTRNDIIEWGEALMIEPGSITAYFFTQKEVAQ